MNRNGVSRRAMLLTPLALRPLRDQADGSLKVTKFVIRVAQVRVAWRTLVMLEIHTDGGLIGLGEASAVAAQDRCRSAAMARAAAGWPTRT